VDEAVEKVRNQPLVDPTAVAVLGHSLGGIRVVAYNSTLDSGRGIRAAVAIAPGSESWCLEEHAQNDVLQDTLRFDMDNAHNPLFLFQPLNDQNLSSTVELSHELGENRSAYQSALFPKVRKRDGEPFFYGDFAHQCFVEDKESNDRWNPVVLDFIRRYGVK
jgi:hypothetical protein